MRGNTEAHQGFDMCSLPTYNRREPAPYFVGPRCAFVCVCVCLCVFVCVLSSRYLVCRPPSCVCRVGTPPARK